MIIPVDQYRGLLRAALGSADDAGTQAPDLKTLFTPDGHRLALDPDATIVRGGRGVGKTVWFKSLQDDQLRSVAATTYRLGRLNSARVVAGYGEELRSDQYPGPAALKSLVASGAAPTEIWDAVLLTALGDFGARTVGGWHERIDWLRRNPELHDQILEKADREATAAGVVVLVLFDALERLSGERQEAERLIGGLLRIGLELRTRTRSLRAKIFIRHDMFGGDQLEFPDASKLTATAADLTWTPTDLYGLLYHLMGNAVGADDTPSRFRRDSGAWNEQLGRRYSPPPELVGDQVRQRLEFEKISGGYMGTDHRKGRPYTWLPNHLVDGIGQVSPRSFLSAVRRAVDVTSREYAAHPFPLHWDAIRQGVQQASRTRVAEISENLPWVKDAVTPLSGSQVPIEEVEVLSRWEIAGLDEILRSSAPESEEDVRTGPRSSGGHELVEELRELGVMTRRADGRLDLPDIYRIAFNVGRRGGVPRIKK
jgi:hypothetical protein